MITVETYNGTIANKKDCRFIKGQFYIKNKQCFLIDGVWYRINSGFITYDYEINKWILIKTNTNLIKGIVAYDENTSEFTIGYFTRNLWKNVTVNIPDNKSFGGITKYSCISQDILPKSSFVEHVEQCEFFHKSKVPKGENTISSVDFGSHGYPLNLQYCFKHYDEDTINMFTNGVNSKPETKVTNIGKYIGYMPDYTFGFEFETSHGKIPNWKILKTGLVPLRDGSIRGIEYATIPLQGTKGITILENACFNLKKYTSITTNESLHLHIGNVSTSKKFVAYLFTLCCIIEKEIYNLFPKYYDQTSKFKARGKDYNIPLRKDLASAEWEETFNNLVFYLGAGKKYQGLGSVHHNDPDESGKWRINERYHWVNFIPLLFGKVNTIEFRCHVPTHDPVKVINWLYICSAILSYADYLAKSNANLNNYKDITLDKIISHEYNSKLSYYLNAYITLRKTWRKADDTASDYSGNLEVHSEIKNKPRYLDINE